MTEPLHRVTTSVPIPREATDPAPAATAPTDDWSILTPQRRRLSELEQLRIDLAAGR